MRKIVRAVLALVMLSAASTVAALPITDVVAASDKWNQQSISMEGRLCVDGGTVYLASTDQCDVGKEEENGGFMIPLVLTKDQYAEAAKIMNGSKVAVLGAFRIPPAGAIRMTRGILLGYSIVVTSIARITN